MNKSFSYLLLPFLLVTIFCFLACDIFNDCGNKDELDLGQNELKSELGVGVDGFIQIGDSLGVSISLPTSMEDVLGDTYKLENRPMISFIFHKQKEITLADANFNYAEVADEISTNHQDFFSSNIIKGEQDFEFAYGFQSILEDDAYNLHVIFRPEQTGLYALEIRIGPAYYDFENFGPDCGTIIVPTLSWQSSLYDLREDYYGDDVSSLSRFVFEVN